MNTGWRDTDRRALRSVALQFWMNGLVFASFLPRLPEIRSRLGLDLDELGLVLTGGVAGGIVASALCGRVIERLGTRRVLIAGSVGLVVAVPLVGLSTSALALLAALIVVQFFDVLVDVAMNMQASWLSGRRAVPVMNRLHGLWSVGTVVGGLGATVAASRISLQVHLLLVGVVLLATLVAVAPGLLTVDEHDPDDGPGTVGDERAATTGGRSAPVAMFGLLGALAILVEVVPADWAAIRLVDDLDLDPGLAGLGFVAVTLGMVTGRFGGDRATAALGLVRLSQLAVVVSAAGLAVATLVAQPVVATVGFFVAGLGAAVVFPGLYDLAAKAPGRPGAVLGGMTAGIRVGILLMPVAIGTLAAGRATVGQAMAAVGLAGAVVLWLVLARVSAIGGRP